MASSGLSLESLYGKGRSNGVNSWGNWGIYFLRDSMPWPSKSILEMAGLDFVVQTFGKRMVVR